MDFLRSVKSARRIPAYAVRWGTCEHRIHPPRCPRCHGRRCTCMTAAEISARAEFARRLARDAGALAGRYFRREIEFVEETKGPQDFVSAADHAVEALIRER